MALTPGTRIGSYEITAQIGVGGMGEVYRATDTNLNRQVAIKVLPEAVASDAERLARFDREAKTLAALSHPNIAAIYGLERSGGQTALVMELVEGPTLADRIAEGSIPVDEALPIAKQIADALEAAHEQGIVHRDLKPANVKVRPDGTVKVLDFGLAKAMEPAGALSPDPAEQPTITTPAMTQAGMLLGTAAYMSPEQAKGRQADRRSDVWAFGCVLFEMLTRRRAFGGDELSTTLARVIEREPEWDQLPRAASPRLRELLERCLTKDVRQRKQSIGDVRVDLERAADNPRSTPERRQSSRPSVRLVVLAAIGGVVVSALAAWLVWPVEPVEIERSIVTLPAGQDFFGDNPFASVTISPDGRTIVYVGEREATWQLYKKSSTEFEPTPIEGTDGASQPFFSPDSRWVAFFADGELRKVSLVGGAPERVADARLYFEGTWDEDDTIIFGGAGGLYQVPAGGGAVERLTSVADEVWAHRRPQVLPGGHLVLFTRISYDQEPEIAVLDRDTGETRVLLPGAGARYVPSGHLVFGRSKSLWAAPFDPEIGQTAGDALPVEENVLRDGFGTPQFAISRDGTLAYVPTGITEGGAIVLVDRRGNVLRTVGELSTLAYLPRLSPNDGRRLLMGIQDSETERFSLWQFDLERGDSNPVVSEESGTPAWSADGRLYAFLNESGDISVRNADGSGTTATLYETDHSGWLSSWSRDGRWLGLTSFRPATGRDAVAVSLEDSTVIDVAASPRHEGHAMFSPDGQWIAYEAQREGRSDIHVRRFPEGESYPISVAGGNGPIWDPSGRAVYYSVGNRMMMVTVDTADGFEASRPEVLFEGPFRSFNHDVSPDGETFVMIQYDPSVRPRINVVRNWFAHLRRLPPSS